MTWLLGFGLVLCLLVVMVLGLGAYGAKRWADTTQALTGTLEAAGIDDQAQPPSPPRYDARELEGLPAPVQRLFTVANSHGGGEIARGEFMRFVAEAAWYPTALLPSQGVQWQAVDDTSANATITDGSLTLTLLFRFNDAGLIDSFRAEARGAMVGKEVLMLPWEGRWSNYQTQGGMTVPLAGEVAWVRPEGRKPYFIGTVTALRYEFSP